MLNKLKCFNWGYTVVALLLVLIGICFISFGNAFTTLALSIGLLTTLFGIIIGVTAMAKKVKGFSFGVAVTAAVIFIISGFITAALRDKAVGVIADVMCLLLIVDGSFKIYTSAISKRFRVVGWWISLSLAAAVVISAFLVTKNFTPNEENMATFSAVVGIIVVADGVSNLLAAFYTTANERRAEEEIIKVIESTDSSSEPIEAPQAAEPISSPEISEAKNDADLVSEEELSEEGKAEDGEAEAAAAEEVSEQEGGDDTEAESESEKETEAEAEKEEAAE